MPELDPNDAAYAASAMYNLIYEESLEAFGETLNDKFAIGGGRRFTGEAGALFWKDDTGFAVVAKGKSPGRFAGEVLLAFRGSRKNVKDLVLTDGNVGIRRSHGGHMVHAGFNKCFESFKDDLSEHMRGWNPTHIHCVGHSLGGALAGLTAEWLHGAVCDNVSLYTFGSPRIGGGGFSKSLTASLGAANIYRVSHRADLVPMIPLWPFVHVPDPGTECFVDKGGNVPGVAWHDMERYRASVKGPSWADLRRARPRNDWQTNVKAWLGADDFVDFSVRSIGLIQDSIIYVVEKICRAAGISLQLLLSAGLTIIDALALILEKGLKVAGELASWVGALLGKIAKALGIAVRKAGDLTATFIRWLLGTFAATINRLAARAIDIAHPS